MYSRIANVYPYRQCIAVNHVAAARMGYMVHGLVNHAAWTVDAWTAGTRGSGQCAKVRGPLAPQGEGEGRGLFGAGGSWWWLVHPPPSPSPNQGS